MTWLVSMGLINAALATVLAVAAFAASRWSRRPALAHALWVVVLLKLLTPPLVEIPVGWRIDLTAIAPAATLARRPAQHFDALAGGQSAQFQTPTTFPS